MLLSLVVEGFYEESKNKSPKSFCSCFNFTFSLQSLDVSHNKELAALYCYNTELAQLDVSHNPQLFKLLMHDCKVKEIDLSQNPQLKIFNCTNTGINDLNLQNNHNLETLVCSENALTKLDLSNNSKLQYLDCSGTSINQLDLSRNKEIVSFICAQSLLGNVKYGHKIPRIAIAVYGKLSGDHYEFNLTDTGIPADKIKTVKNASNLNVGSEEDLPAGVKLAAQAKLIVPKDKMDTFNCVTLSNNAKENTPNAAKLIYRDAAKYTTKAVTNGKQADKKATSSKGFIFVACGLVIVVVLVFLGFGFMNKHKK